MTVPFKLTCTPKKHQKDIVEFVLKNPNSIIASETGSGKTISMIAQAMIFLYQKKVDKVLQIVTKKSKHSFEGDYNKLTNIDVDNQIRVIYDLDDLLCFIHNPNLIIGVVQYENFKNIPIEEWEVLFSTHKVLMQLDEYHKAKTPMSELFIPKNSPDNALREKPTKSYTKLNQHLYKLRPLITYITGYTATPLTRNLDDLFWLCTLTQPGIFNDSLLDFYNMYYDYSAYLVPIKKGSRYKRTIINIKGYRNTDILIGKLSKVCFNYFPPKDIAFIPVDYDTTEVSGEYKKAVQGVLETYNERKIDEETGEKEDKTFSARLLDAQYVLNNSHAKKVKLLDVLRKTIDNGVIIYGNYYNTMEVLNYVLANAHIPYREISGKTTDKQCKENMAWFNNDPENKAMLLTAAGAQSINLQSTNNFIFYELPWNPGAVQQAIGRMIRIGSKYTSFNVYIIASKSTVEEYKYEYLASNEEMIRYIHGNPNYFPTGELKNPNTEILRKLRRQFLWDKAN